MKTVAAALRECREPRVAAVAELARELGLRFREAALLDAKVALAEADRTGNVNVTRGTKGGRGRYVDRLVPVTATAREALVNAAAVQGRGRNVIPSEQTYGQWRVHAYNTWRAVARDHGLRGFHDLRTAYACERYETLTGSPAPVIAGGRVASRDSDAAARAVIAQELGHTRTDVTAAYLAGTC